MKVLVTGAAGFIGSNFVKLLSAAGIHTVAVDSLNNLLYPKSIKEQNFLELSKLDFVDCKKIDLVHDTYDFSSDEIDLVFNLAAIPGQHLSWTHTSEYFDANVILIEKLLFSFKKGIIPNWIQVSTSSVYGEVVTTGNGEILRPSNPYGVSKLAGEQLLLAYQKYQSFNLTILRLFSVFGPGQRPDMGIHKFLTGIKQGAPITIYGDGLQSRQMTYVDDVTDVFLKIIRKPWNGIQIFDVAGAEILNTLQVLESCEEVVGKTANRIFISRPNGDQIQTQTTDKALEASLGKLKFTNFKDGLLKQWTKIESETN